MEREGPETRWTGSRVLVTGATGFLGHHVAVALSHAGASVRALVRRSSRRERLLGAGIECAEGDLGDQASLERACAGCERVFHLAGLVHFGGSLEEFRRVNREGTRAVLEAARAAGVARLVHTSSIVAVGGTRGPASLGEHAPWDLGRLRVPYVTSKREAEELALAANGPGLEVVVVNPAVVVGPEDFARSFFGNLCRRFWGGRVPFHFGGGGSFADVRDVARAHLEAAERGRAGERYILGGENLSWGEFFGALERAAGRRIFRLRLPGWLGPPLGRLAALAGSRGGSAPSLSAAQARLLPYFFFADSRKAREELGYAPRPLAESLRDAYEWHASRRRSPA